MGAQVEAQVEQREVRGRLFREWKMDTRRVRRAILLLPTFSLPESNRAYKNEIRHPAAAGGSA